MTSISGKNAVVVGGSSGVGRATVALLLHEGARVTAIARRAERLEGLGTATLQGDATDPATAERVIRELAPDFLVISAGVTPTMAPLDQLSWAAFSETWNTDVKASFHFVTRALALPLRPGSTVVLVSSGAAKNLSPLSGGYAGAKRMQWLLAGYAQRLSDARDLGLRFVAVLPDQLIEGTTIAAHASAAYGALNGISAEAHMKKQGAPLDVTTVAAAIVAALRGEHVGAIAVKSTGIERLP